MVRVASPTFVGRLAELAFLDQALDYAEKGHTRTILIGGDAGVGKTRLLQAWNERAVARGARVAAGSCLDLGEAGPAYVAVVEAFRALVHGLDASQEEALVGPDRTVLARIVPELGLPPDSRPAFSTDAAFVQTRLFDRLVDVLQRATTTTPIILELEDIHWADLSSQAFLLYLVEVARDAKLLVIGTYRPDAADTDPAFRTTLAQIRRRPTVLMLPVRPFDDDELREQITGILGAPPSSALLTAIQSRSEGNALFAEELAAMPEPSLDLPASVAAATATTLERLSANARFVLRVAAVCGRTATYDVLRAATSIKEAELVDALRDVVQARLLEPSHVGEAFRFRHALFQQAIYDDCLPGERRRLHAAVAVALSDDPDRPPADADLAPRLARHWYEAREYRRAFSASRVAATAAYQQSAYAEAATHYERLLELWDRAGDARHNVSRAEVYDRAAEAAFLAADYDRSAAHGREALTELQGSPDDALQIRVLDRLARTTGRQGVGWEQAVRTMAAIDPEGRSAEERLLIDLYRARCLEEDGLRPEALEAARTVVDEARTLNDAGLYALAAATYAEMLALYDLDEALLSLVPARKAIEQADDAVALLDLNLTMCEILAETSRVEELEIATSEAMESAARAGLGRWARPTLRQVQALAYLRHGRFADSLEQVELGMDDAPSGQSHVRLHLVGAQAAIATGAFEEAARHLDAARVPGASDEEELGRGWLATARAQLALAERRLDDVRSLVEITASRVMNRGAYSDMSETVWWLADVGLEAEADRAERARAADDQSALTEVREHVALLTGYLATVRRQRDAAKVSDEGRMDGYESLIAGHRSRIEGRDQQDQWTAVADRFPARSIECLTARYHQAEAMLRIRASRAEVREVVIDAYNDAMAAGARPLASRLEALARRARIDLNEARSTRDPSPPPTSPDEPPMPAPGATALKNRGLSDREIEVLTLVAAGYSNSEIAGRLFISSKTASVHVSHILDKLGVSTRTEAATIGVRLGLPEVDE